jgi:DNA-binding CsgD family transcriptional regulator
LNWLDADPWPRLIVNQALAITWMNGPARQQLPGYQCLSVEDGLFSAADPEHSRTLRDLVANCRDGPASGSLECGDIHVIIRGHRIPADGQESFVGLRIHTTGEAFPHGYSNLHAAFGLTRSETTLMQHLAKGLSADLVAKELAISLETVRSHIRNIYRKVGASGRESLFHRLRPFLEM